MGFDLGVFLKGVASNIPIIGSGIQALSAQEAYDKQVKEMDRRIASERAYNDPSAQAERLLKAGINPYWSNRISSGSSGSYTNITAPNLAEEGAQNFKSAMEWISEAINMKSSMLQQDIYNIEKEGKTQNIAQSKGEYDERIFEHQQTQAINDIKTDLLSNQAFISSLDTQTLKLLQDYTNGQYGVVHPIVKTVIQQLLSQMSKQKMGPPGDPSDVASFLKF